MEPKPGYKSTEFWGAYPGALACFTVASELPKYVEDVWTLRISIPIAILGAVFSIAWYVSRRTDLKKSPQ